MDRRQFEQQAMRHVDTLYRVARRLTRHAQKAEDLVQETYLRAFRFRDTFEPKEFGIRPWLIRIMHNLHYSLSGREQRQPHSADESLLATSASVSTDPPPFGADAFEGMDQRLARAINHLQTEYQTVMLMWAVEEMSYKEIAEALDVPIGTVMSRLHRARQKLSEQLGDLARELGLERE